jgi:hypothetical protein
MFLILQIAVVACVMLLSGSSKREMKEYTLLAQEAHSNSQSFVDFDMLTARNEEVTRALR